MYRDVDSLFGTSGSATIVAAGSSTTIEMLVRFRAPISWAGSEGSGTGGRTQFFDFGGVDFNYSRDSIKIAGGATDAVFSMTGGGVTTWATLADGNWHHLAIVLEPVSASLTVRLWIDGESPNEFRQTVGGSMAALTQIRPGNSYKSKGVDIDELSIYSEALPATLIAQRARETATGIRPSDTDRCEARQCTRLSLDGGLVPVLYETGFNPTVPYGATVSTTAQMLGSPLPRPHRGSTMPRMLSRWITGIYGSAPADPKPYTHWGVTDAGVTATQREIDALRAPEMNELASKWNYAVNGALSGDGDSFPSLNPYVQFIRNMPAAWPLEVLVQSANEQNQGLPLVDANGNSIGLSPASSTATYQAWATTSWAAGMRSDEQVLQHKLDMIHLDFEGQSYSTYQNVGASRWATIQGLSGNATTLSYCTSRNLAWNQCLASGITDIRNAISTGIRSQLTLPASVHYFSNSGNETYDGDFRYTRLQNDPVPVSIDPRSNGSDRFRYSSPYVYPRSPLRWYQTITDRRGLSWVFDARAREISEGSPWALAYVSAGWSYDETKNIRPPQWLGMLKLMGAAGALDFIPAVFVIPSAQGAMCSWGVCNDAPCDGDSLCLAQRTPNPNHYVWQALVPSYAQASISKAEDILRSPSAVWLGELPVNSPATPATGFRLGSRAVIATALMPYGNDAAQYQRQSSLVTVGIDHDGSTATPDRQLTLETRVQGSVYLVDFSTTPTTVLQQDAWHEWLHPTLWSQDLQLDVEAADATRDVVLRSEAPGAANGLFSQLTGYLSVTPARAGETFTPSSTAPQVEFDVEPRTTATYTVWVRARATTGTGSVYVWQDTATAQAARSGCIAGSSWRWVRLDCAQGAIPSTLTISGGTRHALHVSPSQGGIEIDRVVLSRNTQCIAAATNCSCTP